MNSKVSLNICGSEQVLQKLSVYIQFFKSDNEVRKPKGNYISTYFVNLIPRYFVFGFWTLMSWQNLL